LKETQLIARDQPIISLRSADFLGANLFAANLQNINLSGAIFGQWAWLDKADLSGSNLSQAIFLQVELTGANLSKTDLRNSRFTSSDLSTDLRDSRFTSSDLSEVDFSDADLSEAKLIPIQYKGA